MYMYIYMYICVFLFYYTFLNAFKKKSQLTREFVFS